MAEGKHVLNLDDVFGVTQTPKVRWQGREYGMLLPEALGPRDFLKYDKLKESAQSLQGTPEKAMTEEQTQDLENFTQDLLAILAPDLAKQGLPFMARVRVLSFYNEQTSRRDKAQKKGAKKQTGASSIRAWLSGMAWGFRMSRTPHLPR